MSKQFPTYIIESGLDNIGTDVYDQDFSGIDEFDSVVDKDYADSNAYYKYNKINPKDYRVILEFTCQNIYLRGIDYEEMHKSIYETIYNFSNTILVKTDESTPKFIVSPIEHNDMMVNKNGHSSMQLWLTFLVYFKELRYIDLDKFHIFMKKIQIIFNTLKKYSEITDMRLTVNPAQEDKKTKITFNISDEDNKFIKNSRLYNIYNAIYDTEHKHDLFKNGMYVNQNEIDKMALTFANNVIRSGVPEAKEKYGLDMKVIAQFMFPYKYIFIDMKPGILEIAVKKSKDNTDKLYDYAEFIDFIYYCIFDRINKNFLALDAGGFNLIIRTNLKFKDSDKFRYKKFGRYIIEKTYWFDLMFIRSQDIQFNIILTDLKGNFYVDTLNLSNLKEQTKALHNKSQQELNDLFKKVDNSQSEFFKC